MTTLSLTDPTLHLTARGDELRVMRNGAVVHKVPVGNVSELIVFGNATIGPAARNVLLRHDVSTLYLTADGRYRGRLSGRTAAWPARRLAQYALHQQPQRLLAAARGVASAKVRAQRRVLTLRARRRPDSGLREAAETLNGLVPRIAQAGTVDMVRGLEGTAARTYFSVFPALLTNPDFMFSGRTRHPPRDPVNAMLSFGYALLQSRVEAAVERGGLDVYLGVLHGHLRGAPSAALDLMEPYRPRVDALVLTLINRQAVRTADFERPPPGAVPEADADSAVYLGREGRKVLVRSWAQFRMGTRLPGARSTALLDHALDQEVIVLRQFLESHATTYEPWLQDGA